MHKIMAVGYDFGKWKQKTILRHQFVQISPAVICWYGPNSRLSCFEQLQHMYPNSGWFQGIHASKGLKLKVSGFG